MCNSHQSPYPVRIDYDNPPRHKRDPFHAWLVEGAEFAGPMDMPVLEPVHVDPAELIAFSDAKKSKRGNRNAFVHFFEDDAAIQCFWNRPRAYLDMLLWYKGALGNDLSVSYDAPAAIKYYNYYRNAACTYWLQKQGVTVVPQARCEPDNAEVVLVGFPKDSTIAIGARSMVSNVDDRIVLKESVRIIADFLSPRNILWYGSLEYGVADYLVMKGIPIHVYPAKGRGDLSHHKPGGR